MSTARSTYSKPQTTLLLLQNSWCHNTLEHLSKAGTQHTPQMLRFLGSSSEQPFDNTATLAGNHQHGLKAARFIIPWTTNYNAVETCIHVERHRPFHRLVFWGKTRFAKFDFASLLQLFDWKTHRYSLHSALLTGTAGALSDPTALAIPASSRCYERGARNPTAVGNRPANPLQGGHPCQSFSSSVTALNHMKLNSLKMMWHPRLQMINFFISPAKYYTSVSSCGSGV